MSEMGSKTEVEWRPALVRSTPNSGLRHCVKNADRMLWNVDALCTAWQLLPTRTKRMAEWVAWAGSRGRPVSEFLNRC